jgi:hypothetical protein
MDETRKMYRKKLDFLKKLRADSGISGNLDQQTLHAGKLWQE